MTNPADAQERAADAALERQPRNLAALLAKAAFRAGAGDDRAATSFYQLALGVARGARVPNELLPALHRGEAFLAEAQTRYEAHLRGALAAAGAAPEAVGGRFRQSIDILTGRAQPYLQQPTSFYYPGLPQTQFYERDAFPWLVEVEAATPAIAAELSAALAAGGGGFAPYIAAQPGRPRSTNPLFDDPSWSALYLWRNGALQDANAARFPATMAALAKVPLPFIASRAPMALFSALRPGTHIIPHNGHLNTRLICHLPLIVPPGCRLRVGNEVREWRVGETLVFDDSIEHEAWNDGAALRVVLLFEIWRPELSAEERRALTALYEAIDLYGAAA